MLSRHVNVIVDSNFEGMYVCAKKTDIYSTQPEITDLGVNTSYVCINTSN